MRNKNVYKPQKRTAEALMRGLEMVRSVSYRVSARWVFYRLLQEGYYSTKSDYNNKWIKASSRARHAFWGGWQPDTLEDSTREAIRGWHGHSSPSTWLRDLAGNVQCNLARWHTQPNYVELWFEARAMADQFRHYTSNITLRPMAGQPSIPYKWEIAKFLEEAAGVYRKPIVILYFGDLDPGGECIEQVTCADVGKWCYAGFQFIRCGLNDGDPERYDIPENFDKPGEYQWEALSDAGAKEIITSNIDKFVHHGAFSEVKQRERKATAWLRAELADLGKCPA